MTEFKRASKEMYECQCGCGANNVSPELIRDTNRLIILLEWEHIAVRGHLISGCRCVPHNKDIGGSEGSLHISADNILCLAEDIMFTCASNDAGVDRQAIPGLLVAHYIRALQMIPLHGIGFGGVGVTNNTLHLDMRNSWQGRNWIKGDNGKYVYGCVDFHQLLKEKNRSERAS